MFESDRYHTSAIKLFHIGPRGPQLLANASYLTLPAGRPIKGFICRSARILLDMKQSQLWTAAGVSHKTLIDFELDKIDPKLTINLRLRAALERAGARFVHGDRMLGVVVVAEPAAWTSPEG